MESLNIYKSRTGPEKVNIVRFIESKIFVDYFQSIKYARNRNSLFIPILRPRGEPKNILTGSRKIVALLTEEIINGKKT